MPKLSPVVSGEVRLFCAAEQLLCRSVWSERSGAMSSDKSCSSYAPDDAPTGQTAAVSSRSPHKTQPPNVVEGLALTSASLFAGHQRAVCRLQWMGVRGVHATMARCCVVRRLQCRAQVRPQQGADPQRATEWCKAPPLECRLLTNASSDNDQVVLNIHPSSSFTLKGLVCNTSD